MNIYLINQTSWWGYCIEKTIHTFKDHKMAEKKCEELNKEYWELFNYEWKSVKMKKDYYIAYKWQFSDYSSENSHYYEIEVMELE